MLAGVDAIAAVSSVGTITYGPVPQSIPALSGSMLIILGLLFAVLAYRVLRTHSVSKPLASIVAVGVLVLGAASGNQLIQNAQAIIGFAFSNPSGGTLNITDPGEQQVSNTSGQPQRVISVTPHLGFSDFATIGTPHCTAGLTLQNNSFCYINFTGAPG
jgi:hypothetical protein